MVGPASLRKGKILSKGKGCCNVLLERERDGNVGWAWLGVVWLYNAFKICWIQISNYVGGICIIYIVRKEWRF